uniref:Uncharacterized protein n=1 Tax=Sphaerodactylus townsendi TaxID=933632 RepID=A0ACB8FB21_9SAUR
MYAATSMLCEAGLSCFPFLVYSNPWHFVSQMGAKIKVCDGKRELEVTSCSVNGNAVSLGKVYDWVYQPISKRGNGCYFYRNAASEGGIVHQGRKVCLTLFLPTVFP